MHKATHTHTHARAHTHTHAHTHTRTHTHTHTHTHTEKFRKAWDKQTQCILCFGQLCHCTSITSEPLSVSLQYVALEVVSVGLETSLFLLS
jgi:ABC-type nickel/cobalt efflux system permease component RcnA